METTGLIDTLTVRIGYNEIGNVGLPAENKILGVKEYNNVAYIVSGIPCAYQVKKSETNNFGPIPFDSIKEKYPELYSPVATDGRRNINNESVQITSPSTSTRTSYELYHKHSKSGWGLFTTGITLAEMKFVPVYTAEMDGSYMFNMEVTSLTDKKKPNFHNVTLNLYTGTNQDSLVATTGFLEGRHTNIIEGFRSVTLNLKKGDKLYYGAIGQATNSGSIDQRVLAYFTVTSAPVSREISSIINIESPVVFPASSRFCSNGGFSIAPKMLGGILDSGYSIAIGEGPFRDTNGVWDSRTDGNYNLAPGTYTVYIKKTKGTSTYYLRDIITIGYESGGLSYIPDLNINVEVYDFTDVSSPFKAKLWFADDTPNYSGWYKFGYTINGVSHPTTPVAQQQNAVLLTIPALGIGTVVEFFVTEVSPINGGPSHPFADPECYRESRLSVPISNIVGLNNYNIEVGTYPSPNYDNLESKGTLENQYRPLNNYNGDSFKVESLFISGKNYLDMEIQPTYDGSANIIFVEAGAAPRIVNSGFSVLPNGNYEIINRNTGRDTNSYNSRNVDVSTRLFQYVENIPKLEVSKVNPSGGKLEVGTYKYFIKFGTVDENETDILEETGLIPIWHGDTIGSIRGGKSGEVTTKSIELTVKNIDPCFNHVALYFVINSGDTANEPRAYKVSKKFIIPDATSGVTSEVTFTHTGFEGQVLLNITELSVVQSTVSAVATIAQIQNRLFAAKVSGTNVDYNSLFKVGLKVCTLFSLGTSEFQFSSTLNKWPLKVEDDGKHNTLDEYGVRFMEQKTTNSKLPDINIDKDPLGTVLLDDVSYSEGFYNPLYAEKYTGYWPMETYKNGICFILEGNVVTSPVPVVGADYCEEAPVKDSTLERETAIYDLDWKFDNTPTNWKQVPEGINFNKLGVTRFPKRVNSNVIFYPKFKFNKTDLINTDPEFFTRVKGFFFVRAERKPDILMEGALLNMALTITEAPVFSSDGKGYLKADGTPAIDIQSKEREVLSAYPLLSGKGIFSTESSAGDPIKVTTKTQLSNASDLFIQPGYYAKSQSTTYMYKYWFNSGDAVTDSERAAASFNGNACGLVSLTDAEVINFYKKKIVSALGIPDVVYDIHALGEMSTEATLKSIPIIDKVITDYLQFGIAPRSGGGFTSQIPYKSGFITKDSVKYYPTGNFNPYIGITSTKSLVDCIVSLYPNALGALTKDALQSMYSSDEVTNYIPITPRYSFDDFQGKEEIEVVGYRGDCFATRNMFNIAKALPTVTVNPASDNPDFREGVVSTDGQYNSYRADEASLNLSVTHASNNLSFARHPEIIDEMEAAKYGKMRSFLPYLGASDFKLYVDRNNKLPETSGFNKGYRTHFNGRLLTSVSSDSPYVKSSDGNTVLFSQEYSENSFYNAYRDFQGLNKKNYNKELGSITKVLNFNNNLITVHQKGVTIIDVNGQTVVGENNGGDVNIQNASVLNPKANVISSEFGSDWIRSIVRTDNSVVGVDVNRFKVWMIKEGRLEMISNGKVNRLLAGFLNDFKDKKEVPGKLYIASFYDKTNNDLIFSFYNEGSNYTDQPLPMDVDEYYMMESMGSDAGRQAWVDDVFNHTTGKTTEQLKDMYLDAVVRKKVYERYKVIRNNFKKVKHLTLVYNEDSNSWVTRLGYSPEFMFNINGGLYSINNDSTAITFDQSPITFNDKGRKLIWDHNSISKNVPTYGSFYGKAPEFEYEFIVAEGPGREKSFEAFRIIGNESVPSGITYQVSEDCPWLKVIVDTKYFPDANLTEWGYIGMSYALRELGHSGLSDVAVINPYSIISQKIYDRRYNPIFLANYEYGKDGGVVSISRNLKPMYFDETAQKFIANAKKYSLKHIQDRYLKVRVRYTNGQYTYVKAIITDFNYTS